MKKINITIPSIIENIRIVESFIDNAKTKHTITDEIYGNIIIAVTESVSNAIIHGNKKDKTKNVYISLEVEKKHIKFEIKDEGFGFDYLNVPNPTAPENLEKPNGRGVFLISNLCDKFIFNKDGTSIELYFNL